MLDKLVAISQLNLVRDVIEHIKSYLFYDREQILRERNKKMVKDLEEMSDHWIFK